MAHSSRVVRLEWGSGADAHTTAAETVYSYGLTYAGNSDIAGMTDSVMGTWTYAYNDLNSLSTATAADGRRVPQK